MAAAKPGAPAGAIAAAFDAYGLAGGGALAVSGGSDSLALMHLVADEVMARGLDPVRFPVLTVDHGLRDGSADEARRVSEAAGARGLSAHVLTVTQPIPAANRQAAARAVRYRLMGEAVARQGLDTLLLAHTEDDQAETLLLRLARGSGVDGLGAMAPATRLAEAGGVRVVRPLLTISRAALRSWLGARGYTWKDDPSNADPAFARVRVRRLAPLLAREGLSARRLGETAARLRRARAALDHYRDELLGRALEVDPAGFARLRVAPVLDAPEEVGLRALEASLRRIAPGRYRPRLARLQRLYSALAEGEGTATLAGCRLLRQGDRLLIAREMRAIAGPLTLRPGEAGIWDGRFEVRLDETGRAGRVAALGRAGLGQIVGTLTDDVQVRLKALPAPARAPLPAFWRGERLVAVPHLGLDGAGFAVEPVTAVTA